MATDDLHFKIRAYLRQHGKTDMTQYHLDWANGQTMLGRWNYNNVPTPSAELLAAVSQRFLDYESETPQTCDIYRVVGSLPSGDPMHLVLSPVRRPDISTECSGGSVLLQPGLYKFLILGKQAGLGTVKFDVFLTTVYPAAVVRRQTITTSEFDFTSVRMLTSETEINLGAQHADGAPDLNVEVTLVIDRL